MLNIKKNGVKQSIKKDGIKRESLPHSLIEIGEEEQIFSDSAMYRRCTQRLFLPAFPAHPPIHCTDAIHCVSPKAEYPMPNKECPFKK